MRCRHCIPISARIIQIKFLTTYTKQRCKIGQWMLQLRLHGSETPVGPLGILQ